MSATVAAPATSQPTPAPQAASTSQQQAGETKTGGLPASLLQKSSLYVGDLDPSVNEGLLFEVFSRIGSVHSIRVCRDAVTRRSLGYAYVNYNANADPSAAQKAMEELNYTEIAGRPIRIMWSQRDPSTRRSGLGNVFIKNLDPSIDHKALHDTFAQFGKILSCKIVTDTTGNSKGYGFVHFEEDNAAKDAIDTVNNKMLRGSVVFVGHFMKRTDRMHESEKKFTNLYVKNLEEGMEEEGLREMFAKYGEITSAVVMKDRDTGKSRQFGFVNFADPDSARKAIEEQHDRETGRSKQNGEPVRLYVQRAQKRNERQMLLKQQHEEAKVQRQQRFQGLNVYVRNLGEEVNDEELRKTFGPYGQITSSRIMRDTSGVSRGFGFVCFASQEEASKAITQLQGAMLRGKPLYVAQAQPKEVRRLQLERDMADTAINKRSAMGGAPPMPPTMFPGMMFPNAPMHAGAPGMFYPPQGMGRAGMMGGRGRGRAQGYMMGQKGGMMPPYGGGMMPRMQGQRGMRGGGRFPRGGGGRMGPGYMYGGGYQMGGAPRGGRGGMEGYPRGGRGRMGGRMGRGEGQPGPAPQGMSQPGQQVAAPAPEGAVAPPPVEPQAQTISGIDPKSLAALPEPEQKNIIGEKLFQRIVTVEPNQAGKITGMLLEMDLTELLLLLESQDHLNEKIDEALLVLKAAGATEEAQPVQ